MTNRQPNWGSDAPSTETDDSTSLGLGRRPQPAWTSVLAGGGTSRSRTVQREARVKRMSGALFGDDRGHPDAAATHSRAPTACGRPSRLRRRQRGGGLPTPGPGRGLRLRSGHARALRLRASRQARRWDGAQVPRRRTAATTRRAYRSSRRSAHGQMSGLAKREVLRRQFEMFADSWSYCANYD